MNDETVKNDSAIQMRYSKGMFDFSKEHILNQ